MSKTKIIKRYTPKKYSWATRFQNFNFSDSLLVGTDLFEVQQLCENPQQSITNVGQKYLVKNVEVSVELEANQSTFEDVQYYIMFCPEGLSTEQIKNLPFQHPEYIMAYKFYGSPQAESIGYKGPLFIKSRLARKLESGDKIVLIVLGSGVSGQSGTTKTINIRGLVKYNVRGC